MVRAGVNIRKSSCQTIGKIFIKQQFHDAENSRSSRCAAKASAARISSCVRSGKSARTSCSVMPPAKYPSTSDTVIRVSLMMGLPLRMDGSSVMRFNRSDMIFSCVLRQSICNANIARNPANRRVWAWRGLLHGSYCGYINHGAQVIFKHAGSSSWLR